MWRIKKTFLPKGCTLPLVPAHISGFPLERVFYISIQALIKKLLYSPSSLETHRSFSSPPSGWNGAFGNQMSSLLPGWSLSSNFIVFTEWLSPSGKHLMLSSALAPLRICLGRWLISVGTDSPCQTFVFYHTPNDKWGFLFNKVKRLVTLPPPSSTQRWRKSNGKTKHLGQKRCFNKKNHPTQTCFL